MVDVAFGGRIVVKISRKKINSIPVKLTNMCIFEQIADLHMFSFRYRIFSYALLFFYVS